MEEMMKFEDYIPKFILNQKNLSLTQEQQAYLASFPFGAIQYAFNNLKGETNFGLIKYLAHKWSEDHQIYPNFKTYNDILDRFDISIAGPDIKPYTQDTVPSRKLSQNQAYERYIKKYYEKFYGYDPRDHNTYKYFPIDE